MKRLRALFCISLLWLAAACSPTLDWREFRAEDGGFSVLLPQRPGQAEKKLASPAGEVMMKMYSVRVDDTVLGAGFVDFVAPPDAATQEAMHAALLKNIDGSIASDKPIAARPGFSPTGREIIKRGRIGQGTGAVEGELRARFFVKDKRYFQLVMIGRKGAFQEADVDMFMTSFKAG